MIDIDKYKQSCAAAELSGMDWIPLAPWELRELLEAIAKLEAMLKECEHKLPPPLCPDDGYSTSTLPECKANCTDYVMTGHPGDDENANSMATDVAADRPGDDEV